MLSVGQSKGVQINLRNYRSFATVVFCTDVDENFSEVHEMVRKLFTNINNHFDSGWIPPPPPSCAAEERREGRRASGRRLPRGAARPAPGPRRRRRRRGRRGRRRVVRPAGSTATA